MAKQIDARLVSFVASMNPQPNLRETLATLAGFHFGIALTVKHPEYAGYWLAEISPEMQAIISARVNDMMRMLPIKAAMEPAPGKGDEEAE